MKAKISILVATFLAALMLMPAIRASADANSITFPNPPPSNNQTWYSGGSQNVQWTVPSGTNNPNVTVSLIPYSTSNCIYTSTNASCSSSSPYILASNIANSGSYTGGLTMDMNGKAIPAGQYVVNVYNTNSPYSAMNTTGNSTGVITVSASSSTPSNNIQFSQATGTVGSLITVTGSGFATSTANTIQFGSGNYLTTTNNSTAGNSFQFTVPFFTQPCSSSTYPATATNTATTTTALGTCATASSAITPGSYNVSVTANGTTYSVPFTVTSNSITTPIAPTTGTSNFSDGALVQVSGSPTVYLVSDGKFMPFSSGMIFLAKGYQWSQVQSVSSDQVDAQNVSSMSVSAPDGSIIKSSTNPTIFLIVGGQKSGIPSMAVFNKLKLKLKNIIIVSDQDLQSYSETDSQK